MQRPGYFSDVSCLESPLARSTLKTAIMVAYSQGMGRDRMREIYSGSLVDGLREGRGTSRDRGMVREESFYAHAMRVFNECLDEVFGKRKEGTDGH